MSAVARACWLPKAGHAAAEYEDAYFLPQVRRGTKPPAAPLRLAVADGATEASFAGLWARLLVSAFGSGLLPADGGGWREALPVLQTAWLQAVRRRPLPWYAEAKLESGAFAAFAGVAFHADGRWTAAAVGDSCLFLIRADDLAAAFPLGRATEFGSRPWLVGSHPTTLPDLAGHLRTAAGRWAPGDSALLMTDALAAWFLAEAEAGGRPWQQLPALAPGAPFARHVAELRRSRRIRNDDVTLLTIALT